MNSIQGEANQVTKYEKFMRNKDLQNRPKDSRRMAGTLPKLQKLDSDILEVPEADLTLTPS